MINKTPSKEQLLSYAAKAAKLNIFWKICSGKEYGPFIRQGLSSDVVWDPIESNEDAFMLAVKLGIKVIHFLPQGFVVADHKVSVWYEHYEDNYAATRMVITLAAYNIGLRLYGK